MTMLRRLMTSARRGRPGGAAAWLSVLLVGVLLAVMVVPVAAADTAPASTNTPVVSPVVNFQNINAAGTVNMAFPVLGTNQQQVSAILTGFKVQWGLFSGLNGQTGNALYYLALTFALVGLLLVIMMPKNRSPGILVPWFIVLLVMIFAPYNSRLLFWPVDNSGGSTANAQCTANTNGGSSQASVVVCGFTPEVVAVHLGSTLSLIVSDIMTSKGLQDVVAASAAASAVDNDPGLHANANASAELAKFGASACRNYPILPKAVAQGCQNATGSAPSTPSGTPSTPPVDYSKIKPVPVSAASIKSVIDTGHQSKKDGGNDHNQPTIVFPKTFTEASQLGFTSDQYNTYTSWIKSYAAGVSQGSAGSADSLGTADGSGHLDVTAAVTALMAAAQANQREGGGTIGYYASTVGGSGADQMKGIRVAADTANGVVVQQENVANSIACGMSEGVGSACSDPVVSSANTSNQYLADSRNATGSGQESTSMNKFWDSMKGYPNLALAQGSVVYDSTQDKNGPTTTAYTVSNQGETCFDAAENTFKNVLNEQLNGFAGSSAGQLLVGAMTSCQNIDSTALQAANANNPDSVSKNLVNNLVTWGVYGGGLNGQQMANKFSNALQTSNVTHPTVTNTVKPDMGGAQQAGWSTIFGGLGADIGLALAGFAGHFVGILAEGSLILMSYFINLMLMFMIVVTPLMFLMGLLIPSNAAGMLALTSMGMLILTMVPMTVTIINFLLSTVQLMSASVLTGGTGLEAWFWDGVIKFAAASLYLNVIGLTMFIMFKIGDPSNIRGLTELERGAKEMASAGKDAAIALGTIAATVAVGGIAGGAGGAMRALGNSLPINHQLRRAAMERRTGGEEDGPDDAVQKQPQEAVDDIIAQNQKDAGEKVTDPLGSLQPNDGIDGLGEMKGGLDAFNLPGMDPMTDPLGGGVAPDLPLDPNYGLGGTSPYTPSYGPSKLPWPEMGSYNGQVSYQDEATQVDLATAETSAQAFAAAQIMAADAGKQEHQFNAGGQGYKVNRAPDGKLVFSKNDVPPGMGGGTGPTPTGPGAPSGSGGQFAQQPGVAAMVGGIGGTGAAMGAAVPAGSTGGSGVQQVQVTGGQLAVTNLEAMAAGAALNEATGGAKAPLTPEERRGRQMATARQAQNGLPPADTGVRPGSTAPAVAAGGGATRGAQQQQAPRNNPGQPLSDQPSKDQLPKTEPKGQLPKAEPTPTRTIRINGNGTGVLVGGGADGKDLKLSKDFVKNLAHGNKVEKDDKGGATLTLKGDQVKAVTTAANDIELNNTVGGGAKSKNFQDMGEYLSSIEKDHDRMYDALIAKREAFKKEGWFTQGGKTELRHYKEGDKLPVGMFKNMTVPKGGLTVEEFTAPPKLVSSVMGGAAKGFVGGLMGSLGGIGGGASSLPFVKQALTVMREAGNEWSQGAARMEMIGQTHGSNKLARLMNYGLANQRMAHDQWLRNGYARVGAANAAGTNTGLNQQLKATLSDAFNSRRAADAGLVEGYLARMQNSNAKDGVFSTAHHRAAVRADAIAKVENFDKQAISIRNAKIEVGDKAVRMSPAVLQQLQGAKALNSVAKNVEEMFQTAAKHEVGGQSRVKKLTDAKKMAALGKRAYDKQTTTRLDLGNSQMVGDALYFMVAEDYHKNAELAVHAGKLKGKIQDAQHRLMMEQITKQTGQTYVDVNVIPNFIYDQQAGRAVKKMIRKEISHERDRADVFSEVLENEPGL